MCGIAGWFSSQPYKQEEQSILKKMQQSIAHRGPDGDGIEVQSAARFVHTRLAIIDLQSGYQPLRTRSGSVLITYNGEVYNFREIRKALIQQGVQFASHSDTEVIAALYEKLGLNGFSKLRGMFAFALWDERIQRGYLVRDGAGIKPLFYKQAGDQLWFASEAKALCVASGAAGQLDESALHLVMNFRYVLDDRTMFRGIRQLEPGKILEWRADGISEIPLPAFEGREYASLELAVQDSVASHLISDIPVASYLSGGIDSATIVAIARKESKEKLDTYTLDIGDDALEAQNACQTAAILGVNNTLGHAQPTTVDSFRQLIWHLEVPKVNAYQVDCLARLVSQRHKVVLSGLGADELFTGYNLHQIIYFLNRIKSASPALEGIASLCLKTCQRFRSGVDLWPESFRALELLSQMRQLETVYGLIRNVWDRTDLRSQVYGPRMMDAQLEDCSELLHSRFPTTGTDVQRVLKFERETKLVNDLLWQEDRCSMAHGVEVRVPFVDSALTRYVDQFDIHDIMPKGKAKYLLKTIAAEVLPEEVLSRKKSGFQVQAATFFYSHLNDLSKIYLDPDRVKRAGLFNPRFIQQVLSLPPKKKYRWHYFMLYLAIGAHVWLELFEET